MSLGDKLSRLRKENNYTQEQLADILGVSRQAISKWESDVAYPETDKLIRLSALYHCSLDYLVRDDVDALALETPQRQGNEMSQKANKLFAGVLRFAPLALYSLWALLLWAFYALPLVKVSDNSLYKWFDNSMVVELQPTIIALISLGAASGVYIAVLGILQRFAGRKANFVANLCSFVLQVGVFVCAMCLVGIANSVGLESGKVVVVVATVTSVFALLQAVFMALDSYFNHDSAVDLKPRKTVAAVKKCWKFVTLYKAVAIALVCVLIAGIALSVVLPLTVGNIFRASRVSRIQIGDSRDDVIKVLGKPVDIDTDKLAEIMGDDEVDAISKTNMYYYCSPKAEKLLKQALRIFDKVDNLSSSVSTEEAKIILAQSEKLLKELNKIEFQYIEVYFEKGAVAGVEFNSKYSMERANDKKWNVSGNKKQKTKFIPNEIPYGETPYSAELYAQVFYTDGSYRLSKIENLTAVGNATNGWIVEWNDHWGSYKRSITESADSSNVAERGDIGENISYAVDNINDNGIEGYALKIIGQGMLDNSDEYGWSKYAGQILEVSVTNGILNVPDNAFKNFTNLKYAILPDSIKIIGKNAFYGCDKVATVNLSENLTNVGDNAFYGCSKIAEINFYENLSAIGAHAFEGCASITKVHIPRNVATIGSAAFAGCKALRRVTWEARLPSVGTNLFANTPNLTRVDFEWGVEEIPEGLFSGCTGITDVTVDGGRLDKIGARVFENCTSLKNVDFQSGFINNLGEYMFSGCTSLERIEIPNDVSVYPEGIFQNCTNLRVVHSNYEGYHWGGIHEIQDRAFYNCQSLTDINLPGSYLKSVGSYAFYNCALLEEISLWSYVFDYIGAYAFAGCTSLTSVTLDSHTSYADSQWYCRTTKSDSGGIHIWVASGADAAVKLTTTYSAYHWYIDTSY